MAEKSNLENLEEDIYSRDTPDITKRAQSHLSPHIVDVKSAWTDDTQITEELSHAKEPKRGISFVSKFFFTSIVLFLIAAGVAAYMILGGFNTISSKNVDITIQGPTNVAAGEEVVLEVTIHNKNNVDLESVNFKVEYPEGTREPENLSTEKTRTEEMVGSIASGRTATRTLRAVFFGEKDEIKQLKLSIDYKARGGNANFSKEKVYDISIKSAPIVVTVDYPKEINANQEVEFVVTIVSNATEAIEDLLLRAEYPFGFVFSQSNPVSSFDKNIWKIGTLNPTEKKTFSIKGKVEAQNDEERTVRFTTGLADKNDEKKIAVDFITITNPVLIKKPFIGLAVELAGSRDVVHAVKAGGTIEGNIAWTNNLPVAIQDVGIRAILTGTSFDRNSVDPGNGFFRSTENTIVWDKNMVSNLRTINPGDSGDVDFRFNVLDFTPQSSSQNKNISFNVNVFVAGTRVVQGEPNQTVTSESRHTIKIVTEPSLRGNVVHSVGPFENTGPMPPRADLETTYTVVWSISNTFNDLGNTVVSAKLPVYVEWKGLTNQPGQVIYDEQSRIVSWAADEIKAGTGYGTPPKEVAFQVGLIPSVSQIGSTPTLADGITMTATDRFTGKQIVIQGGDVSTHMSEDPEYSGGDDEVHN